MTASGKFSLVVFDWDGTLMDTTGAIVHAIRQSAADLGLPVPSRERASHVIGLGMLDALSFAVPDLPRERIPEYLERYRAHYLARDATLSPFEGIVDLLERLAASETWVAVATGKSRAGLDRALRQTGWSRYFVTTRTADEGAPKPDPWMLRDICEELGVDAAEAVMIGDTTHDLDMATAAGTAAIGVTYGAHPRAELASRATLGLVDHPGALADLLLPRVR
jgi:phosphoglycolate phosphatase